VLALWLTRLGVRVRIIDRTEAPGTTSRALAVQARTLEFHSQIGLADIVVAQGVPLAAVNLWVAGRKVARVEFGAMGVGLSPFPYALIAPQDAHERVLIEGLSAAGISVERQTTLRGFEDRGDGVRARVARPDGSEEELDVAYLAGCDGASSDVREALGIGFPGGTYEHLFYVADVEARGRAINGELNGALDEADFLAIFPLKGEGRARIVGAIRTEAAARETALSWDDVGKDVIARLGLDIRRVHWFSTYHVHHRVADRFGRGRVFLAGDAAHIHSPVGGQGMNTGIGDAVNLAWKLANVVHGRASAALLDTYEPERIAFARRLVATTDRVFTGITRRGPLARRVRLSVVPRVLPALFRLRTVRRFMFRTISQTVITYRGQQLSAGRAGRVHGGDRLPWVSLGEGHDNFAALASLAWQVHVYGEASTTLRETCRARGVSLHVFTWRRTMRRAGLLRNAVYLARPDGHVALASTDRTGAALASYLDARGLRFARA
jgi:2-polyprenyl-6-methoxyphenol hydroxylase-like FAD-dependent oxidoreductase